jgi:hypothetical protein
MKPITAIIVLLLLVASLSVAGCTSSSSSNTVSTDYPTSGRSNLVGGAVEYLRSEYNIGYLNEKQKSFDVNWISNTQAQIHEEFIDTQDYSTIEHDYTITHFPSTAEATTYLQTSTITYAGTSTTPNTPIIDYYKITGTTPTVYKVYQEDFGLESISQFDSLIVEYTATVQNSS